jgi:hypothetical protein
MLTINGLENLQPLKLQTVKNFFLSINGSKDAKGFFRQG